MDVQALKLELLRQLINTSDVKALHGVKRLLDLVRTRAGDELPEHDEELLAAANLFGNNAYGDDEPDISGLELKRTR